MPVATLSVPPRVPRSVSLYLVGTFTLLAEAKSAAVSVDMAGVLGELSPPQAARNAVANETATVKSESKRLKTHEFCMMFPQARRAGKKRLSTRAIIGRSRGRQSSAMGRHGAAQTHIDPGPL